MREYEPWVPIDDKTDLKHGLKAMEEFGDLISAMARCMMQGLDEKEPLTGKPNRQWLMEESADAALLLDMCVSRFGLPREAIAKRQTLKISRLRNWLFM